MPTLPSSPEQLLGVREVLKFLPISRQYLWKPTVTKNDADRIPSYRIRGKRFYRYAELIHYLDSHRFEPKHRV